MIKQIREHPKYAVDDNGNVYIINSDGLLELKKDISNGYARVKLDGEKVYDEIKNKTKSEHERKRLLMKKRAKARENW